MGGILSQKGENGVLHLVAFYSKKHFPAEANYEIYHQGLIEIVRTFEEWQAELDSVENTIQVLLDYKKIKNLCRIRILVGDKDGGQNKFLVLIFR